MHESRVHIRTRANSKTGSFAATISLRPQDLSEHARAIIAASMANTKMPMPGEMWKIMDVEVERRGRVAEVKLLFKLHWNETPTPFHRQRRNVDRAASEHLIASLLTANGSRINGESTWSPMDFYEAAHVPPKDDKVSASIIIDELEATLYPYQKRTLQWLLRREGVEWCETKREVKTYTAGETAATALFRKMKDDSGEDYYLSQAYHAVTRSTEHYRKADLAIRGGILAEEMGLGKTLEILGLILLHTRPKPFELTELEAQAKLIPTAATLIVTPESLRAQWMSEMARHAPGLRIKFYPGCKKLTDGDEQGAIEELTGYDVVVTTYSILSAEIHFATTPPERSRRHERVYQRPKSPLVQISWWRVCLDEAQMIENGFSQAATTARVIPRVNAWGITGTPVKDDVRDLFGLLLFLRYEPYASSPQVWQGLIKNHKEAFQQLFRSISLRHTKSLVRDELQLPPQKRFVISMPFTAVEEQHYQSLYSEMAEACGMSLEGAPTVEDWMPEDYEENMRTWLNRLRQTALHPEVAVYNRRTLGHGKSRPMRTVEEVLDAMLEQSENMIRTHERSYLSSKLTRGQMFENSPRVREALEIWQGVRKEATKLVSDAREELQALIEKGVVTEKKLADPDDSDSSEDDLDEGDRGRLGECQRRLRGALEMHHKAVFFCANAYFQIRDDPEMTDPDSEEFERLKKLEDEGYDEAKVIRREILRESHHKATKLMKKIAQKATEQSFVEVSELTIGTAKGIESGRVVDELEVLYGELNDQAELIDELREHIIQLLLKALVDEEDDMETTGAELGDSTKIQDELMVFVQTLRAVIADRQDAITGQTNELVKHETETSLKLAHEGEGPAPEKMIQLMKMRAELKPASTTSMRAGVGEFRSISLRFGKDEDDRRAMMESEMAKEHLEATRLLLSKQNKIAAGLEAEVESFKTAMNARVNYYRQLQGVSDSVEPYDGPRTEATIQKLQETEDSQHQKLFAAEAKHRYRKSLQPFITCTDRYSSQSQGGRCQVQRAAHVRHLPVSLYYGCLDGLRPSVLQGMHDAVVQGSPQLPRLQEEAQDFQPARHHHQPPAASGARRLGSRA